VLQVQKGVKVFCLRSRFLHGILHTVDVSKKDRKSWHAIRACYSGRRQMSDRTICIPATGTMLSFGTCHVGEKKLRHLPAIIFPPRQVGRVACLSSPGIS